MAQLMLKGGKVFFCCCGGGSIHTTNSNFLFTLGKSLSNERSVFSIIGDRPRQDFANEQQLHR